MTGTKHLICVCVTSTVRVLGPQNLSQYCLWGIFLIVSKWQSIEKLKSNEYVLRLVIYENKLNKLRLLKTAQLSLFQVFYNRKAIN